jgi:hypothetical protein
MKRENKIHNPDNKVREYMTQIDNQTLKRKMFKPY